MAQLINSATDLCKGGAIFEASDGTKLALIYVTTNALFLYKNIDSSPSLEDSDTVYTIHGGAGDYIGYYDACIDSNDDIHIVSASNNDSLSRNVSYCKATYSGGSWTFGTWEEAASYTEQAPSNPGCAIAVDSSNNPYILYVDAVKQTGSTADNVYMTYHNGSSWQSAEQVGTRATKTDNYNSPRLCFGPTTSINALYYFSTNGDPAYKTRSGGSWGSEYTYSETSAVIGEVLHTGSTPYRYHTDASNNIDENNSDTGYNAHSVYNQVSAC